jgi:histone deacetylase 1/2
MELRKEWSDSLAIDNDKGKLLDFFDEVRNQIEEVHLVIDDPEEVKLLSHLKGSGQISHRKAMGDHGRDVFIRALKEEFGALGEMKVFTKISDLQLGLPEEYDTVGLLLNYKVTEIPGSSNLKVKCRACLQGNMVPSGSIGDTYSPALAFISINIAMVLAVMFKLVIRQLDIKNAYLHASMPSDRKMIMVKLPKELLEMDAGNSMSGELMAILQGALYGHPESGRLFNELLDEVLLSDSDVKRLGSDPAVYHAQYSDGRRVIILCYVDDLLVLASDHQLADIVIARLSERMTVKDMHGVGTYCGQEIQVVSDGIMITQTAYIEQLVEKHGIRKSNRIIPISEYAFGNNNDDGSSSIISLHDMQELVGTIRYPADHARLDILFGASAAAGDLSGIIGKSVMEYLVSTKELGPIFRYSGKAIIQITVFTDASYLCKEEGNSYYGYCIYLSDDSAAIAARCGRITAFIPTSVFEAELYAVHEGIREGIYIKEYLRELNLEVHEEIIVYCDNSAVIALADNVKVNRKSRCMIARLMAIRNYVMVGKVRIVKVSSEDNVADIFTKPLSKENFIRHRDSLLGGFGKLRGGHLVT